MMQPLEGVDDRPALTPDRWTRICAVLDELSESSAEGAEAVLAHACRCYRLERGEIERLLHGTPDATFLERLPDDLLYEVFAAPEESEVAVRIPAWVTTARSGRSLSPSNAAKIPLRHARFALRLAATPQLVIAYDDQ